ncbi:MAG: HAD family phosphatase, partial [Ruminococcus sp.]|nr:HAD family phosphatase [Candidatus Copronaster equi]
EIMIKNIVFDLGGVIADFNPECRLAFHFEQKDRKIIYDNVYGSNEWVEMDKGTISLEETYEKMCSKLPNKFHEKVRHIIYDHTTEMPPIDEMYDVVKSLKENGYKIYLLSNCPDWFDDFKNSVPALGFFDGFIISAWYNQIKPEKDIYLTLLEKFGLKAEECFFIDDSAKNIKTADELGMKSFCFAERDFDALKKAMIENNIII